MNYSLFVITGLLVIGFSFSFAYAHVTIEVGSYEVVVGWQDEPPIVGILNAITIDVREPGDVEGAYMGVTNAFRNLDATVISGGISKSLDIQAGKYPAEYYGEIIPTKIGQVEVKLVGEINGIEIDEIIRIEDVETGSADNIIPRWIKNNAGWWANDQITENEFLRGVEYLIENDIIVISSIPNFEKPKISIDFSYTKIVPDWIKNNAGWWADGQIDDGSFVSGLQWLISNDVIQIESKKIPTQADKPIFASGIDVENDELVFYYSDFFDVYCFKDSLNYELRGGNMVPICSSSVIALNTINMDVYDEIAVWNNPQKVAVVYPIFTASAYQGSDPVVPTDERGFYAYYQGRCDDCTTVEIISESNSQKLAHTSSGMGIQTLSLLGYDTLSDIDIDQNPNMLKEFDVVILLHNEYVTRTMFDAITDHPNVLYLYPNALYAEIEVDYTNNTITLIRGHNYPEPEITNGFDWEFDNTYPYEYDSECLDLRIYEIKNGWMTTCYPDLIMKGDRIMFDGIKFVLSQLKAQP